MSPENQKPNGLEWAIAGLGALLILVVFAFLVTDLVGGASEPVRLRVTLGAPMSRDGQAFVPVRVTNEGGQTAEDAMIEVCAGASNCAEVSFAYVPRGSARDGVVGLQAPLDSTLQARVESYRTP